MTTTEKVFTVDTYLDKIREVPRDVAEAKQYFGSLKRYEIFETHREAMDFMVDRAERLFQQADKALIRADSRLTKCEKLRREMTR